MVGESAAHLRVLLGEPMSCVRNVDRAHDVRHPQGCCAPDRVGLAVELLILFDPQGVRTHVHAGPYPKQVR